MDRSRHIGGIDFVRFAAAALVMNFHLGFWSWGVQGTSRAISGGSAQFPELKPFTWFGGVGVQIFFVISGFVIAGSARDKTPLQFLKSRFWRLFPTIWICAPISAAVLYTVGIDFHRSPAELLLRSLVLYPFRPWVDAVYWSLIVEVVFYSVVLLMLSARLSDRFEELAFVLATASATYFISTKLFALGPVSSVFLLRDGCYFALGIAIWLIRENGARPRYLLLCLVAVCGAFLELDSIRKGRPDVLFWSWIATWCIGCAAICLSAMVQMRGARFTRMLGLLTYPLYLLHDVVGCAVLRLAPRIGRYPALLLAIITVVALAYVVYRLEPAVRPALERAWMTMRQGKATT